MYIRQGFTTYTCNCGTGTTNPPIQYNCIHVLHNAYTLCPVYVVCHSQCETVTELQCLVLSCEGDSLSGCDAPGFCLPHQT